jgi:hypothetical protein
VEIHAPDKPIHSFRDVAIHLAIVTTGILIALGLEQSIEWYHHRKLLAEANESLVNEIRENRDTLQRQVTNFPRFYKGMNMVTDLVNLYIDRKPPKTYPRLALFFYQAPLRNISWTTAQAAGATAYMPYSELHRDASVYQTQDEYNESQKLTEALLAEAARAVAKGNDGNLLLPKLSPAELESSRSALLHADMSLRMQENKISRLMKEYTSFLEAHGEKKSSAAPSPKLETVK